MTDLRAEFERFISEFGNDIIYVRRILGLHCRCWNEKEQSGNPRCLLCFGTGYSVKIEVHRTRSRSGSGSSGSTLTGMLKFNEPGTNVEPGYFFYMKYNVVPVAGDLILDVNWDGTNVNQLVMPYAVSFPEPYRGDAGRIEYWRVAVQTIARDQDIFYQGLMKRNVKRSVSTQ